VTVRNITEKSIMRSNPQLSSIETANAVPRKSILLSGTVLRYTGTLRPIVVHDSSATISSPYLFITDSAFIDNTSIMYQSTTVINGSIAYSLSNYLLLGSTIAASAGTLADVPKSFQQYLTRDTKEVSIFFRFNTYSKPWSFSWRPELLIGNVTGENFYKVDSLMDSTHIDFEFRSLTNTITLRYQINKGIGFFWGVNFISRPYAVTNRSLITESFITPYVGADLRLSRELTLSLCVSKPTASILENYTFPMQLGAKIEWQWFFRRNQEATP